MSSNVADWVKAYSPHPSHREAARAASGRLFVGLLLIPGFAPCMDEVLRGLEGKTFRQMLRDQWLYTFVWMLSLGWGAWALVSR
jgi:hypothetical protein